MTNGMPEPWLRGTWTNLAAVPRAVVHALELAQEDLRRWCGDLTDEQVMARPCGMAPLAFHLRHIARSVDRLLTYAEGQQLSAAQMAALKSELETSATRAALLAEVDAGIADAISRVSAIDPASLDQARVVGRKQLPTTVGGLLVHVADHTQRHVGEVIVTVKLVRG